MIRILMNILDYERDLVLAERADGKFMLRPTTIAIMLISTLYILSPIDIVPEKWINPSIFGFVDDFIIFSLCLIYTYIDWGEVVEGEVSVQRVPIFRVGREDEVPLRNRDEEVDIDESDTYGGGVTDDSFTTPDISGTHSTSDISDCDSSEHLPRPERGYFSLADLSAEIRASRESASSEGSTDNAEESSEGDSSNTEENSDSTTSTSRLSLLAKLSRAEQDGEDTGEETAEQQPRSRSSSWRNDF